MAQINWSDVKQKLTLYDQDHLLKWVDELTELEQQSLYADISAIDFDKLQRYYKEAQKSNTVEKKDDHILPLDESIYGSVAKDKVTNEKWFKLGLERISRGEVGVLLLAGGQGTRLGVPYPKGMYDVDLPSKKTLYQLQAERILRLQQLAKESYGKVTVIPWYIMTSEYTRDTTEEFFKNHSYFGLDPNNVIVFEQNTLPCLDYQGRILLDQKHRIAKAPDGNGGLYAALSNTKTNMLEDMKSRGLQCVHVYGVDNILVKMADPVFVGFCTEKGADCGAKVVRKFQPTEKVGVVCLLDGKYQVVEYSEISIETAEKRNSDGTLTYSAGNICNHYFTLPFLERVCGQYIDELSHHIANKKIPFVNETGERVQPSSPNGIKMEKFVFDVFQFSKSFAVLEVLREDEFAPLKNGPGSGSDSPGTCRAALMNLHYRQFLTSGGMIIDDSGQQLPLMPRPTNGAKDSVVCEVSPLVSYFGEGLDKYVRNKKFKEPVLIEVNGPS